MQAYKAWSWK
jgi:hypothetical protein